MAKDLNKETDYNSLLLQTIAVIEQARTSVARFLTNTATSTYWAIGRLLYDKKLDSKHGGAVVRRLSVDLKDRYPELGTSTRNLWYMKQFYERYHNTDLKVQRCVALLPWKHNILIMSKELDDKETEYYANEDIAKGWNADLLLNAIKMNMYESHLPTTSDNNFASSLPETQAQYANEVFHDTYNFGFLGVTKPILELELEHRLVEKVKLFLMELGKGFTYIGNEYELTYNGKTSRVDMLFFHRGLHSLVAIDLKIGAFKPEYVGKMNYYLSLLDRIEKRGDENNSIGIILCAEKDHVDVELSLEGMNKPIGVADYQMIIPKEEIQKTITDEIASFEKEQKKKDKI